MANTRRAIPPQQKNDTPRAITKQLLGKGGERDKTLAPTASIAGTASTRYGSLDAPIHQDYRRSGTV